MTDVKSGRMKASIVAVAVLIVSSAFSAGVLHFGPMLAMALIGGSEPAPPMVDTIFYLAIFGPMIVFALVGAALSGVNAAAPGRYPLAKLALGTVLGLAGVLFSVVYASVAGSLTEGPSGGTTALALLWGAGIVAVQTGAEEIYFRGWIQPVVQRAWGAIAAILLTAIAFSGLHILGGARSPLTLINLFLGGVMFGLLAYSGRGIAGAFAAHFAWNGAEQLVLGLDPNPGIGNFGALLDLELAGAQAWGGSEEGLNASVAMTAILIVIVVSLSAFLIYRARAETKPKKLQID